MSTRTSIRIGSILDSSMHERLPGYERFLEEYTYQYLLFGYRKAILGHYYAFVLFQASKTFGGITCEVALSRNKEFPYYRFYDSPSLGVCGFRARTTHVLKNLEATTTKLYTSPDVLMGHIMDLVGEAIKAGNLLIERSIPRVSKEYEIWQPHYEDWLEAEKTAQTDENGRRYHNLVGEEVSRRILHDCLKSGRFDGFLGPKKFRYRDETFFNCHTFLLARALAFVEPPEEEEMRDLVIDPNHDPEKIVFDGIAAISGRSEQTEALSLSSKITERVPQWAFLRSFAALEALFDSPTVSLDEVVSRVKDAPSKKEEEVKSAGVSLDELYSDTTVDGPTLGGAAPDPLASGVFPQQPKPEMGKNRCDPFELFEDYIEDRVNVRKEPDTFDFLGSQLGI